MGDFNVIMPEVKLNGVAATFAARDPTPIVTLLPIADRYHVCVNLPDPAKKLHGLGVFSIDGDRTVSITVALDDLSDTYKEVPATNTPISACRNRRFSPPAEIIVSFDFPEAIVHEISRARRCPDGTIQFVARKANP